MLAEVRPLLASVSANGVLSVNLPALKKHGIHTRIAVQIGRNKQVDGCNNALTRGLNATLKFSESFKDRNNSCCNQFSLGSSTQS